MEKFSSYNDPFYGINPFINPRQRRRSFMQYLKVLVKIPLAAIMFATNLDVVGLLVRIRSNAAAGPRIVAANASSFLDVYVLRHLTGITNFYYVTKDGFVGLQDGRFYLEAAEPCVLFPEGCRTNNRAILQFVRDVRVDHVCGLKYTEGCVGLYGGYLGLLLGFLSSSNEVRVEFRRSSNLLDICKASGLPQVKWGLEDRNEFMKRFNKRPLM